MSPVARSFLPHGAILSWRVLSTVIASHRVLNVPMFFRCDSEFALPDLFGLLGVENYWYATRLVASAVLERHISSPRE